MAGNVRADRTARGVHDPLQATAVVLDHGSGPVVMIGCDLLCMTDEISAPVRASLAAQLGVPPAQIVVTATHTHSGPQVVRDSPTAVSADSAGPAWRAWLADLPGLLIAAAMQAHAARRPATLELGSARVAGVAFNRRLARTDGATSMNWETLDPAEISGPRGPVDDRLTTVRILDDSGTALALIVHFTLHPAILVGAQWLLSKDFIDPLGTGVRAGGAAPVLFLNGAEGNINHIDYRHGRSEDAFTTRDRVGAALAEAARTAITAGTELSGQVSAAPVRLDLATRPIGVEALAAATATMAAAGGVVPSLVDGVPPEAYAGWLIRQAPRHPRTIEVDTTVVTIGPLVFVFCPGEPFVEFALDLQRRIPDRHVLVVGLANSHAGYLPTAAAYDEGGYEPTFGTSLVAAGETERLFDHVAELVGRP